ncbi:MAG TPA: sensor histidine kinase N-terminal domain-containing protein, partial [Usitatibacteraceae bacterium]|nr:sensor histidine kinase N-terminal domain-containing protein [Usitatibacteraceae bacterium]
MTDPAEAPAAPRSLFVQLLDWMLVPLVIVWPLAILFTYVAARTIADSPFDRELTGTVTALERLVPAEPPAPYEIVPILPASVSEILRTDETDEVRIQVAHADGGLLLGDADVPPLELTELLETPAPRLKDGEIAGERVRIAFRVFRPAGWDRPVAVQVAETLRKRDRLAAEITRTLVGVLLTLLVILVALVLYGLKRGLEPLGALRERVLARDDEDLRPIPFADVPVEVEPLVATVNRQLERVATSVEGQRRFVADAAHQMKTPLAGMKMQAELAARAAGGDELKVRLGQIRAGADRADH